MELLFIIAGGVVAGLLIFKGMQYKVFWQAVGVVVVIWFLAVVLYYMPNAPLQPKQAVAPQHAQTGPTIDWAALGGTAVVQ